MRLNSDLKFTQFKCPIYLINLSREIELIQENEWKSKFGPET